MNLFALGVILAFIGILIVIVGLLVEIFKNLRSSGNERSRTQVGGIILIGPIPIVFGNSKDAIKWALIGFGLFFLMFVLLVLFSHYL